MFISRSRLREIEGRLQWLEQCRTEDHIHIHKVEHALTVLAGHLGYRAWYEPESRRPAAIRFEKIQPGLRDS